MDQPVSRKARWQRVGGAVLLGVGLLLLAVSAAYYAYGAVAKSKLGELNYSAPRPSTADRDDGGLQVYEGAAIDSGENGPSLMVGPGDTQGPEQVASVEGVNEVEAEPEDEVAEPAITTEPPYVTAIGSEEEPILEPEAASVADVHSEEPQGASTSDAVETAGAGDAGSSTSQADGTSVGATADDVVSQEVSSATLSDPKTGGVQPGFSDSPWPAALSSPSIGAFETEVAAYLPPDSIYLIGEPLPATHIRIPAISVDSEVKGLEVVFLADSYAWETPKWVVGHIPTTPPPGGHGQGWYFGHLESPIRGEGNVFGRLPEIPSLLDAGETVYILLEDEAERKYLYEVYETKVVPQEELRVTDSGQYDITLVTCVPRLVYDHRLMVTAALVGVSKIESSSNAE